MSSDKVQKGKQAWKGSTSCLSRAIRLGGERARVKKTLYIPSGLASYRRNIFQLAPDNRLSYRKSPLHFWPLRNREATRELDIFQYFTFCDLLFTLLSNFSFFFFSRTCTLSIFALCLLLERHFNWLLYLLLVAMYTWKSISGPSMRFSFYRTQRKL